MTFQYKSWVVRWRQGLETGLVGEIQVSSQLRRYIFEKYNSSCSLCGWNITNKFTNKIPLEVEHIDGNYLNNQEDNLTLLCPNCHSLTSTYKGANRGNGRPNRKA